MYVETYPTNITYPTRYVYRRYVCRKNHIKYPTRYVCRNIYKYVMYIEKYQIRYVCRNISTMYVETYQIRYVCRNISNTLCM